MLDRLDGWIASMEARSLDTISRLTWRAQNSQGSLNILALAEGEYGVIRKREFLMFFVSDV